MEYEISNHRHYSDFTIIPNEILRSKELSFFDKGLLCFLLSLPNDWKINLSYIAETYGESERAILKSIKNLIEVGYCKRTPLRKDGKLRGQHYQITDIANDFSAPIKNEGSEKTDPQKKQTSEKADPQKSEGSYKENTLFNEEIISIKEEENKEPKISTRERKCLFAESKFYDFELFAKCFERDNDFAGVDLQYYYSRIKFWSGANNQKKCDWIMTAKNWMLTDYNKGQLKRIDNSNSSSLSASAIKYLQAMAD